MSTKRKPYVEKVKLELAAARVHVWIEVRGKDANDVADKLNYMSDRALLRRVQKAWERTRVMDTGEDICFIDVHVPTEP